ncbi:MAG TPA: RNA polymerase sigma factor [Candidatus Limnocylindrales bacterium]|nr:RNA polymerase sigma factor [Candidatus Limnocylindrales bacterium]
MDDTELARRLASDLDGTFETLVRTHVDRCFSIALRLLADASDAEEVAQDALVRAYRALERYPAERIRELDLRAWLATITLNAARSRRRRQADRRPPLSLDAVGSESRSAGAQTVGSSLASLVAGLPERYRAPIVLRYVDDLTYSQIAQVLGRPEGTLKAQVHRGLALLHAAHDAAEREELSA